MVYELGIIMNEENQTKLDAFTGKYTEGFEHFSNSKSGNLILDFVMFKKNIIQYTLQIVYVLSVIISWVFAIIGIFGQGPIGQMCKSIVYDQKGEPKDSFNFFMALGIGVGVLLFAPFVLHYVLEIVKPLSKLLWKFALHCWHKVIVPIWETVVLRFFVNVVPQLYPFFLERFMKVTDILIDRIGPQIDAMIDGGIAISMTIASVLKGVVWLPKTICQRLGRWFRKPLDGEVVKQDK